MACAAFYLALKSLRGKVLWNVTIAKSTGYEVDQVKEVAMALADLMELKESRVLKEKFAKPKYMESSLIAIATRN